jgi:hypothetical protein
MLKTTDELGVNRRIGRWCGQGWSRKMPAWAERKAAGAVLHLPYSESFVSVSAQRAVDLWTARQAAQLAEWRAKLSACCASSR